MSSSVIIKRRIGDAEFNAIGFGTMGLSAFYGATASDEERFQVFDRAYELGCTHWDTARAYGDSESLIGKWFARTGNRKDIFLATKFGLKPDLSPCGTPEFVRDSVEESLGNLGVDYIDLLYQHRVDPDTPIEITVGAMAELVKEGKVRYLGLSECSSTSLRRAHAVHPIAAIEVEYSPFILDIENPQIGLLATARELGVKVVAYSPMGRGILTGQYKSVDEFDQDDFRRAIPLYQECFPLILKIAEGLKALSAKYKATAGQVALAWLLQQGDDIIPIPGTKRITYLEENVAAARIQLSEQDLGNIRRLIDEAGIPSAAARYPPAIMHLLFADSAPL